MRRPFTFFAIIVFLLIALANAIRIAFEIPVSVGREPIPLWMSAVAIGVALILALGLWYEMRARAGEEEHEDRATSRGAARGQRSRAKVEWIDTTTGMRLPAKYFLFSSNGVSPQSVRSAADKYGRILVGFDAGAIPEKALAAARECDAELSIYVEGPGGPTGNAWAPDERARVRAAAASVGVRTDDKNWMEQWDEWGWKAFTFRQLEEYRRKGYSAAEIDNLDRVLCRSNGDRDPEKFVAFFKEYAARQSAGKLPRLVTKNLSEEQLERVVEEVLSGGLPRTMFSEFHISEKGSGDRRKQDALSSRIGIRTVPSNDTYNYDAKGEFGLETQYAALFTPPPQAPALPPAGETQVATAPPAASTPPAPASPAAPAPSAPAAEPAAAPAVVASAEAAAEAAERARRSPGKA